MECDCRWQLFSVFYRTGRNWNKSTSLYANIIIEFQQQYFPQRSFRKTAKGIGEIFTKINNFQRTCTYVRRNLKMQYSSLPCLNLRWPTKNKIFPTPRKRDIFHAFVVQLNIHERDRERKREFPLVHAENFAKSGPTDARNLQTPRSLPTEHDCSGKEDFQG